MSGDARQNARHHVVRRTSSSSTPTARRRLAEGARSTVTELRHVATESLCRPVARAGRSTLPGASASDVARQATHTTVRSELRLKRHLDDDTGRRNPGSDQWAPRGRPTRLALGDHHSAEPRVPRAAAAENGHRPAGDLRDDAVDPPSPRGACRRRTPAARRCTLAARLRQRWARRSTWAKRASGTETAVFIPRV